ncbi:MAG: cytochrome c biogenesis protein CcsA [Magnetococcales bacterium]|nr:cytochrome c biogenesis protein CcsA [Magnetococcales bacterium]
MKKIQRPLGIGALVLLMIGMYLVIQAPADFQQGNSVRILFIHVPSAKMALLTYIVLTISSIMFLWKRNETADIIADAAAPVGAAFTAVTLATGSIWGKPMWGTWWAWDARLTSMLVLLIIYMGLMALRNAMDDPQKGARATAVLAIIGAVDLPIIHFSVTWWRTLHQPPSFQGSKGGIHIAGPLLTPLLVMAVAFILLGAYLVTLKSREVAAQRDLAAKDADAAMEELHD